VTRAAHAGLSRGLALAIPAALAVLFCLGPLAAYCRLIADNSDALAGKAAMLQRYRALAGTAPHAPSASEPGVLYPDIPESQAVALLQETVKSTAAASRVQVQGFQVLRGDSQGGATRIGVRVRAGGDMASLRGFVYAIETARPLLHPDNLQIQARAATPGAVAGALDFQLDISGFKAEPGS
jgi:hypothetical protein